MFWIIRSQYSEYNLWYTELFCLINIKEFALKDMGVFYMITRLVMIDSELQQWIILNSLISLVDSNFIDHQKKDAYHFVTEQFF